MLLMKIKKLNKKTILTIILTTSLVAVSTVVSYITLLKKDSEEVWYDSNWTYRKTVYIKNIPKNSQGVEEDVLLEIDTKGLISEDKLVEDCRDIRFVDEDNNTPLEYWIEGGCNTTQTQVWVRIKLPQKPEKIIYMYYGNELAADNQEFWGGEFISISTQDCIDNWSHAGEFSGKFLLADSTFGSTGGSNSHNHNIFQYSDNNCENTVYMASSGEADICDTDEDNILNLYSTSVSTTPSYKNINFCSSTNGYLTETSIILIDEETPSGWKHISDLDNRYPRGDDNTNPEKIENAHTHYATCINKDLLSTNGTEQYLTLSSSAQSSVKESEPLYYTMNFISNPKGGAILEDSIIIVTSIPPLGWEEYTEANGRLIKGAKNNFGKENDTDAHFHIYDSLNINTKTTILSKLSGIPTKEICLQDLLEENIKSSGTRNLPPYISVLLTKKKSFKATSIQISLSEEKTEEGYLLSEDDGTMAQLDTKDTGEVLGETAPTAPTDLLTEGETNPTDITDTTPEFSAIYNDPDSDDTSSDYEIEVNTASNFSGTVMWDSEKTGMTTTNQGDRSPDISYAGDTLSTETIYYWRIKFWDSNDNESPWASTANFTITEVPTAYSLYTCGLTNPTYIDTSLTFSAVYTDPDGDNSSNYEIEVNTASNFTGSVMWNTDKTETTITSGSRSSEFAYAGTTLTHDSTVYYVRMRFWDIDDNASDWVTGQFTDVIQNFQFEGLQIDGLQIN